MSNYLDNRKALFNYELVEEIEAGIELFGYEVKAVRKGMGSLTGSYILIDHGEAILVGAQISPYQPGNVPQEYDPMRRRKLLLRSGEIVRLEVSTSKNGLTLVPLSMYNKGVRIKVKIALVRGKKKRDKRQTIQRREAEREIGRTLKRF